MLLDARVPISRLLGLQSGVSVGTVELIKRGRLVPLTPACAKNSGTWQRPGGGHLPGVVLSEGIVVIVPLAGRQGKPGNHLTLHLQILSNFARIGVPGREGCDIQPAFLLLCTEHCLVTWGDREGALILDAAVVAAVTVCLSDGVHCRVVV